MKWKRNPGCGPPEEADPPEHQSRTAGTRSRGDRSCQTGTPQGSRQQKNNKPVDEVVEEPEPSEPEITAFQMAFQQAEERANKRTSIRKSKAKAKSNQEQEEIFNRTLETVCPPGSRSVKYPA